MERAWWRTSSLVKAYMADRPATWCTARPRATSIRTSPWPARSTIVEVEKLVEIGEIDPDQVHTPSIFVHRIVDNATPEKRIEQRTVRAN